MKLLFCGDIVINDIHLDISDNLLKIFKESDYRICNFEGPLIKENSKKIIKAGPHVYNYKESIDFLKSLNINCAALANNHIMDYGLSALKNTVEVLSQNKICSIGAGNTFNEAYEPLVLNLNSEKICIINACQAEFGVLKNPYYEKYWGGYAWVNSPFIKELIIKNMKECDRIIVFIHAGMEEQIVPLPEWKQLYHEFADIIKGKGAIIAAHPHIVQGYENYNNTPIFYSLGNYAFYKDELKDSIEWNRSILVQYDTQTNNTDIIPVSINNNMIDIDNSGDFKNTIEERCNLIKDDTKLNLLADEIVEKTWNEFYKLYYVNLTKNIDAYSGKQLIKILIKKFLNKFFKTKLKILDTLLLDETMLLHNIQIESHRWCVERYLYNKNLLENNSLIDLKD